MLASYFNLQVPFKVKIKPEVVFEFFSTALTPKKYKLVSCLLQQRTLIEGEGSERLTFSLR
jgi:hypothetical protein